MPEGRSPTLGKPTDSASFEAPSTEPPAGPRLGGKLRLARGYPSTDEDCNPPTQWIGAFNANHSTAGRESNGVSRTSHSGHDRSPVRQLRSLCRHPRHCAGLRHAVQTHPALLPPTHLLLPLQDPRRAWGQPSNTVRPLTRARPPSTGPSAFYPVRRGGWYVLQQLPRRPLAPQDSRHIPRLAKSFPGRWRRPKPYPIVPDNSNSPLFSPDSGRE